MHSLSLVTTMNGDHNEWEITHNVQVSFISYNWRWWSHNKKGCVKFLAGIPKVLLTKFHQNLTTMSSVIHVRIWIPKQYQIMLSSVTKVKSINARVIFRYHDNDVSNQVSSNSNNKIKSYSCSNFSTKMGKMKK